MATRPAAHRNAAPSPSPEANSSWGHVIDVSTCTKIGTQHVGEGRRNGDAAPMGEWEKA